MDYKKHWESVFQNKDTSKVSWFQTTPQMSMDLIEKYSFSKSDSIIDIGGGDSRLPDSLLKNGYKQISVLDISSQALLVSRERLGAQANLVNWIANNVLDLDETQSYDLWHDRAVFHFIQDETDQVKYKDRINLNLSKNGIVIIGAFSKNDGPTKCSGLDIVQHDQQSIENIFSPDFEIIDDFEAKHETPSGSVQNFYWVIMKKKEGRKSKQ